MKFFEKLIQRASHKALGDFTEDENFLFVRKNHLFKDLSAVAFVLIMKRLVERRYNHDELIFKQDNLGICLFLVKRGRVEVYVRTDDSEKMVYAIVEEGGLFGEMSLISAKFRTATARALDNDTTLLTLSTFDIDSLNNEYPRDGLIVLKGITDTIAENLIRTTKDMRRCRKEVKSLKEKLAPYER